MAKAREISKNAFSLTTDRCLYGHVNLQNQSVDDTAVAMVSLGSPQRHAARGWAAVEEVEVEDGGGTRPMWPPSPTSTFLHLAAGDNPRRRTHPEGEGLLLALAASAAIPLKVADAPEPASWRGNRAAAPPLPPAVDFRGGLPHRAPRGCRRAQASARSSTRCLRPLCSSHATRRRWRSPRGGTSLPSLPPHPRAVAGRRFSRRISCLRRTRPSAHRHTQPRRHDRPMRPGEH